jgi:hypothetical protein
VELRKAMLESAPLRRQLQLYVHSFLIQVTQECTSPFSGASPVSGEGTVPAHFENGVSAPPVPTQDAAMSTFDCDATPKRVDGLWNHGPIAEQYRLFYVNTSDKFQDVRVYIGASDNEALERARSLLEHHPYAAAIEVWKRGRLVGRIDRYCAQSEQTRYVLRACHARKQRGGSTSPPPRCRQ